MSLPELPANAPVPRLCHLVKWADFDGYGFNLHAEKSRSGQFIGKVDQNSPAQLAAVQEGDRIIEVNGVNIANENHRQVVERIKSIPNETKLLVVDEEADMWYKERKIVVKSTQPNVLYTKTPVPRPDTNDTENEPSSYGNITVAQNGTTVNGNGVKIVSNSEESPKSESSQRSNSNHYKTEKSNGVHPSPAEQKKPDLERKDSPVSNSSSKGDSSPKPSEEVDSRSSTPMEDNTSSTPDSPRSQNGVPEEGLNLNMSASEMRLMLASRKKKDPKKVPMDIRQKYDIIQQM